MVYDWFLDLDTLTLVLIKGITIRYNHMVMDSYFNLFLLMGGVFAILLSFYLLFYPSNLYANKVLGALSFCWSITVFGFLVQSPSVFTRYPHIYASLDVFALLFFPLVYVYVRTYLYKDTRQIKKHLIHFIPGLLYLIVFSPFLLMDSSTKAEMITNRSFPEWFHLMQMIFNLVIVAQGIFYTIISLRKLHHFQYFRRLRMTRVQIASIKWLRLFLLINVILWVIGTMGAILEIMLITIGIDLFGLFYLGLTMLTIVLGVFTIRRPEFFSEEEDIVKYSFSKLKASEIADKEETGSKEYDLLLDYIENEKPYLKPDLKMQDLVDATGLSYKRISQIFNNELKQSFFDYLNKYRIDTAILLLNDGFHKKHTLPHLAEEAGFNSKTTFNRLFKKHTGLTPTEYIQSQGL